MGMVMKTNEDLTALLSEYRLEINTIKDSIEDGWMQKVIGLYDEAIKRTRGHIAQDEFAKLLVEYAEFLRTNKQYHLINGLYDESLAICRQLVEYDSSYLPIIAGILYAMAILHDVFCRYDEAIAGYAESLSIYRRLAKDDPLDQTLRFSLAFDMDGIKDLFRR